LPYQNISWYAEASSINNIHLLVWRNFT